MQTKGPAALVLTLLLSGCAATTPAPRFSPVSPADRDAPEAVTPPAAPALAGEPEAQGGGYTCPMHPEIRQAGPGSCPICGTRLVERKPTGEKP